MTSPDFSILDGILCPLDANVDAFRQSYDDDDEALT